jgi:hypothetical protein
MLSIKEQEDFMHLIFDCVHIGISLESLEWSLKSMKENYGNELINILNTVMKNEKYSNDFIYPLEKVIKESSSHFLCNDFFKIKIDTIKILINYGCDLKIINSIKIDWNDLLSRRIVNEEIFYFIINNVDKILIQI